MVIIKVIDTSQSIFDLVQIYPELKDVLFDLGFKDIIKPMMLHTVGKIMTLKKGSMMRNIDYQEIVEKLRASGFEAKERENE